MPEHVAQAHVEELEVVVHAQRVLRVEDELPTPRDESADRAKKEERRLRGDPRATDARAHLAPDELVEGDEGQRVQVGVGAELLRRRVVLVVLVAPVAAGHAAAEAVRDHLNVAVEFDVARERVVACAHEP